MHRAPFIAALLAAASATAHAQTATVYGLLDSGIEHLDRVGADGRSLTRVPGLSGSVPSRLGFRGSEDLGGGLKADFTLEMGIGVDTGTFNQGGRAFGRQAWVGLSGPWGALTLGRQYTMLFYGLLDADVTGPNTFGSGSLDNYLPNARTDNALGYRGSFGAFTLGATYSFGRDAVNAGPSPSGTNCAGESATDPKACREWSVMLRYATPAWGAVLAVDEIRGGSGAFAGLTRSDLRDTRSALNGWFKTGDIKWGAGVIERRNEASAATPKSRLWHIGASTPLAGLWTLDATLMRLKFDHSANAATLAALRLSYLLSRRTALYATAGHIGNDGTLALSVSNGAAGAAPAAGTGQSGVMLGMRHAF
ncbi:porin [Aquabacterium sp.]|uniref:porin n=1 Tax=Aquabacterium sp. TaxID=1872578 RepID=UPI003783F35B